ncbi:MAG TPA: RNA-guided endonuclease TnpB family protein [Ktedonobacterales bacterium]|nr:RNA-guided endonuclease TnpB family protein [Ktedonobacterales bacterium]
MREKRAYRYRCYPTPVQAAVLARTFGCARFVYNWALRLRTDAYYERHERLSYVDLSTALTDLKRQDRTVWLTEVSSVPTQQALRHLETAFRNFFAGRAKYPTFRKKRGRQSATYASTAFRWDAEQRDLTLAKMDAPLHVHWSRPLPNGATPTTVTVSRDTAGRYFVSILVEEDIAPLPATMGQVGIDLGLHDVVVLDSGEKVGNPRFFQADEKRLAKAQRRLSKKKLGSKNRDKSRRKVARIHARIADRRRDFTHKLSTRIIRENQTICIESLHVKAMAKHPTLAKAIHDVGWGEFVRQLEYKADWYGRTLVKIDRWYPSSKRCYACGHVLDALSLDIRHWTCPACGVVHDRDVNAAKNILAVGLTVAASGETVRPTKASARVGASQ